MVIPCKIHVDNLKREINLFTTFFAVFAYLYGVLLLSSEEKKKYSILIYT